MLRLRVFGGLTLARGEENLTGAVSQRRRLALLALLAVAQDTGISRDKLLAWLWPESEAERARHVLNQLLYAQRRQVGSAGLFLGRKTLRLNPVEIWTDVGAYREALRQGALEEALAHYRGPFLDGFFVSEAPEFEHWVEEQRRQFAVQSLEGCVTLAERAAARGDAAGAIQWWRRAAEQDPLDTRVALGLVTALTGAGDRPGALRAARRHEQALRSELDMAPDARLRAAIERLSSGAAPPDAIPGTP
jgi:DNA-binding SARP family transcriptional activator